MSDYLRRVISRLARILLLLAVMTVPLGMGQAIAGPHSMPAMEMTAGHCPEGAQHQEGKAMPGDCTMACASALPAVDHPRPQLVTIAALPAKPPLAPRLLSIMLDIATPPPRTA